MTKYSIEDGKMRRIAHASARVLISSYFLARGTGLIVDPNSMQQFLLLTGVPEYLLWPNAAFEIMAAFAIMIGFQTRTAAALLALFVFWSSFILNYSPGDSYAIGAFWQDLAMIGGLLMLFSHGRGSYALDNILQNRADRKAAMQEDTDDIQTSEIAEEAEVTIQA